MKSPQLQALSTSTNHLKGEWLELFFYLREVCLLHDKFNNEASTSWQMQSDKTPLQVT